MYNSAWQTVMINPCDNMSLSENNLVVVSNLNTKEIPLGQIKRLLISSDRGSISLPLLSELVKNNVSVIICNSSSNPVGEISSIAFNTESAGRQMDQSKWNDRKKHSVWKKIVYYKIKNQKNLLVMKGSLKTEYLDGYLKEIKSDDTSNREALAAKIYFDDLFGTDFIRFNDDDINSALNYGYAILRNSFSRTISAYGYNNALGIHHCNRNNIYNLACDLMEPFRPFVDRYVYENIGKEFNNEYKGGLVSVLNMECIYGNKHMDVESAINAYTLDVLKCMSEPRYKLKEIKFAG